MTASPYRRPSLMGSLQALKDKKVIKLALPHKEEDEPEKITDEKRLEIRQRKSYRFDFLKLEDEVNRCYKLVKQNEEDLESQEYANAIGSLYRAVSELVFGIFTVNPPYLHKKRGFDSYNEACNHALGFVERVRRGSICCDPEIRQAWTKYLRLNTRSFYTDMAKHPDNTASSLDQILEEADYQLSKAQDMESELNELPFKSIHKSIEHKHLGYKAFLDHFYTLLRMHSSEDDLVAMLPLISSCIKYKFNINKGVSRSVSLVNNIIKRLSEYYDQGSTLESTTLAGSIDKSVLSWILLNYASNEDDCPIPFDLVSCLDFQSMLRLATTCGGKELRVPSLDEVEAVIGSAVALSSMLLDGATLRDARLRAKEIVKFKFNVRRLNKHLKGMEDSISPSNANSMLLINRGDKGSFLSELIKNFKAFSHNTLKVFDRMESEIDSMSSKELLEYLNTLDDSESRLLGFLRRIDALSTGAVIER